MLIVSVLMLQILKAADLSAADKRHPYPTGRAQELEAGYIAKFERFRKEKIGKNYKPMGKFLASTSAAKYGIAGYRDIRLRIATCKGCRWFVVLYCRPPINLSSILKTAKIGVYSSRAKIVLKQKQGNSKLKFVPGNQMASALRRGTIDCAALSEYTW